MPLELTRREAFCGFAAAAAPTAHASAENVLQAPVRRIVDSRAACTKQQLDYFWWTIWPEAVRQFSRCGIAIAASDAEGEIKRSPASLPIFTGLDRGVLNLVVTKQIPLGWARGRGIAGVTTIWRGYHLCLLALDHAHANRIPIIAVNTCVHEMLHAFLRDIYVNRPTWSQTEQHELRVNWLATRLWLFHEGSAIRQAAEKYVRDLTVRQSSAAIGRPLGHAGMAYSFKN